MPLKPIQIVLRRQMAFRLGVIRSAGVSRTMGTSLTLMPVRVTGVPTHAGGTTDSASTDEGTMQSLWRRVG